MPFKISLFLLCSWLIGFIPLFSQHNPNNQNLYTLLEKGDFLEQNHQFVEALDTFKELVKIAESTNNYQFLSEGMLKIARMHTLKNDFSTALRYLQQTDKINELVNNTPIKIKILLEYAFLHQKMGYWKESERYAQEALQLSKTTTQKNLISQSYLQLAQLSSQLKNYQYAEIYIQQAFTFVEVQKNLTIYHQILKNSAEIYAQQDLKEKAQTEYEQLISQLIKQKKYGFAARSLCELYSLDQKLNTLEQALQYASKAENKTLQTQVNLLLLEYYTLKKDKEKAKTYLLQLNEKEIQTLSTEIIIQYYQQLSQYQRLQNQHQEALQSLLKAQTLQDSTTKAIENERLVGMNIRYEAEKSLYEYELLSKQKQQLEQQNKEQQYQLDIKQYTLYLSLMSIVTILFITRSIYTKLSQTQKAVKESHQQATQLRQELKILNSDMDTFLYKASHDLKGPLASMEGITNLALIESAQSEMSHYFLMQKRTIKEMEILLMKLIEIGEVRNHNTHTTTIPMKRVVDKTIKSMKKEPHYPFFNFKVDIDEKQEIYSDIEMLDIILSNIIKNAIENIKEDDIEYQPIIYVKSHKESNCLIIRVHDNGKGIAPEMMAKMFTIFQKGTNHGGNHGLGLYKAKVAASRISAKISIVDTEWKTTFEVSIPTLS
ncbi:MAG: GHKL domain-containing protein [Cytophagales bacterium]|nr:MAG: GHKL domain-containing protein [Cytophagales bacterium]